MTKPTGAEMPFLDHLEELRWRLIWSLGALIVGVVIGFVVVMQLDIIGLLAKPITPLLNGQKLIITRPGEALGIVIKAAFFVGLVLALPVILYQLWAFVAPALYQNEKRVVIPLLIGAVALFVAGAALAYFVVLPFTLRFLLNLQTESLNPMISAGEYFGFAISMSFAFGATFEMPILIVLLTMLRIVTPQFLSRYRRHALVLCAVGAAFITPGSDITSMLALAGPLYLLYELSTALSYVIDGRRRRRALRAEREAGGAGHEVTA
jgi:sec-independent protein translocase protein TatC